MRLLYAVIILIFCSCSTVRKLKTTTQTEHTRVDTSYRLHEYQKETNVTEKSTAQITTPADSVSTSGNISSEDTTEHVQQVYTSGLSIRTAIKPQITNGRITGYQINSNAVASSKTIDVPIDRTTNIKETGMDQEKAGISEKTITKVSSKDKETSGWGIWQTVGIVLALVVAALIMFYKLIRK